MLKTLNRIARIHLLHMPHSIRKRPERFPVTSIASEIHQAKMTLGLAWWGEFDWSDYQRVKMVLKKKKTGLCVVLGAALYSMDAGIMGYLFNVITTKGSYNVCFDRFGFTVGTHYRFLKITVLLKHLENLEDVTFVSRG